MAALDCSRFAACHNRYNVAPMASPEQSSTATCLLSRFTTVQLWLANGRLMPTNFAPTMDRRLGASGCNAGRLCF